MATPEKGNQKKKGLLLQPRADQIREDFPVDDRFLKLSQKKNFKLKNSSTKNEPIPLDFCASVKDILNLRGEQDLFEIRYYAHIAKLILDGKPMLDSREEMLCLAFFELGLSLGADYTIKKEVKNREPKERGGGHSKFRRHEKEIIRLLQQHIADPVLRRKELVSLVENITGETLEIPTLDRWLKRLRNGQSLYKKNISTT